MQDPFEGEIQISEFRVFLPGVILEEIINAGLAEQLREVVVDISRRGSVGSGVRGGGGGVGVSRVLGVVHVVVRVVGVVVTLLGVARGVVVVVVVVVGRGVGKPAVVAGLSAVAL